MSWGATFRGWVLVVLVAGTAMLYGGGFTCHSLGRFAHCVAHSDTEQILPLWMLHSKPPQSSYGTEFRFVAPKDWAKIELRVYPDSQEGVPYHTIKYIPWYAWVRLCKGKAVFTGVVERPVGCAPK
jgi:hypothetical protein